MNMKYALKMMAIAAIAAGAFTACNEGMDDWGTDASYDRLFSPTSLKISTSQEDATTATVEFSMPKEASIFELALSTDSLYEGIDESTVKFSNYELTQSPATITGLNGDTRYYLRFRSKNGDKCSRWVYALSNEDKAYFKTPKEQIMQTVEEEERGEDFITVRWKQTDAVTHLKVHSAAVEEDVRITLDATAIAAAQYTLTGLAPATTYTVTIWNNDVQRGSVTSSTFAAAPKGDYIYRMDESETEITPELLNQLAEAAKAKSDNETSYSATIVVPAGVEFTMAGVSEEGAATSIKFPEGMSVTIFGAAGAQPVLKLKKSVNLAGAHAFLRFENIKMVDDGCQYFINQSEACTVDEVSFKDCIFENFERSIFRTQGSNEQIYGSLVVDNCVGTNLSTGNGYSMILIGQAASTVGKVILKNSTFDTAQRSFIESSKCPTTILIDHCTIYNAVYEGKYLVDANGQNTDITISNTILGKSYQETARGIRTSGTLDVTDNNLRTSDCVYASNDLKDLPAGELSSEDIFTDPANHDFTLKIGDKVGDPRWYRAEE